MPKNCVQVPKETFGEHRGEAQPFHRQLEIVQPWRGKGTDLFLFCKAMRLQSCPTAEVLDTSSLLSCCCPTRWCPNTRRVQKGFYQPSTVHCQAHAKTAQVFVIPYPASEKWQLALLLGGENRVNPWDKNIASPALLRRCLWSTAPLLKH